MFSCCCVVMIVQIAKTRLAVSPPGTYSGIADCLKQASIQGGLSALYRGVGPSLAGIMPYAGVDLAVYSWLKVRRVAILHKSIHTGILNLHRIR